MYTYGNMYLINSFRFGGGAPSSYLVDNYSPVIAFSVRKLSSTATNCLRVRRDSDNAEQDIGFSGDDLDTSSLSSFVGANSAYVVKWYNQGTGGATYDASQATAATQPRIVNAGTIDTKNGISSIYFGGSQFLSVGSADSLSLKPFMWSVLASQETSNSIGYPLSNMDINNTFDGVTIFVDRRTFKAGVGFYTSNENVIIALSVQDDTNNQRLMTASCDNSWNVELFKNGSSQGSSTLTAEPVPTSGELMLGGRPYQGNRLTGHIQEAFIFTSDESANRVAIETDINNYYSIY